MTYQAGIRTFIWAGLVLLAFAALLAISAVPVRGQDITLVASGSTSLYPGDTTTLELHYAPAATTIVAMQGVIASSRVNPPAPSSWTPSGVTGTGAIGTAGKDLHVSSDRTIWLIVGINANAIPAAGHLLNIELDSNGLAPGEYTFGVVDPKGADATGAPAVPTVGSPVTIRVLEPVDLSGDGVVDAVDLGLMVAMILDPTGTTCRDVSGDGVCDVVDAQVIVNAILAGG